MQKKKKSNLIADSKFEPAALKATNCHAGTQKKKGENYI